MSKKSKSSENTWSFATVGVVIITVCACVLIGIGSYSMVDSRLVHPVSHALNVLAKKQNSSQKTLLEPTSENIKEVKKELQEQGKINSIKFLFYSDQCVTCKMHIDFIKAQADKATKQDKIMYVDVRTDTYRQLKKDFDIPSDYHLPTIFSFYPQNKVHNNKFSDPVETPLTANPS